MKNVTSGNLNPREQFCFFPQSELFASSSFDKQLVCSYDKKILYFDSLFYYVNFLIKYLLKYFFNETIII